MDPQQTGRKGGDESSIEQPDTSLTAGTVGQPLLSPHEVAVFLGVPLKGGLH